MKNMCSISIFLLLITFACKDSIEEIPPCDRNDPCATNACQPEECVVNSTYLGMDTLWSVSLDGILREVLQDEDNLYMNFFTSSGFYVTSYSKINGEHNWTYSNEFPSLSSFSLTSDKVVGQKGNNLVVLDKLKGQELHNKMIYTPPTNSSKGYVLNNYYYTTAAPLSNDINFAIRSEVNDLISWEKVYEITQEEMDGIEPVSESYNLWTHPETQDEILVFQHRMAFPEKRIDLVAYNMTADSMYWWHKDIDPDGNSNIDQIFIYDDKAYYQGHSTLACYDILSGNEVWKEFYREREGARDKGFMLGNIVVSSTGAEMIINYQGWNPFNAGMMAINPQTGQIIWDMKETGQIGVEKVIYKDIVFFTASGDGEFYSNTLWAVRAKDGEVLWRKSSFQAGLGGFRGPVAIDEERGVLYTYGSDLLAIKIPEEW